MPDKLFSDPPPGTPIPDPAYRRSIRWRLLILYIADIVVLVVMFLYLDHQTRTIEERSEEFRIAVVANCEQNLENTRNLNTTINQLIMSVRTSKTLTQAEKDERIAFYRQILAKEPVCPPR